MKPTHSEDAAVDLVDVLLREGVVVEADVVVTVADVALVGVRLRAAIAGMTKLQEYGHFEDWDAGATDDADDGTTDDAEAGVADDADAEDVVAEDADDTSSDVERGEPSGGNPSRNLPDGT